MDPLCCWAAWYSLAEQSESPQAVQELGAAALVEVQSGQGGGWLLQSEDQEGPTFFLHCDGPELTNTEGKCPPAPLMAMVQRAWQTKDGYQNTDRVGTTGRTPAPLMAMF